MPQLSWKARMDRIAARRKALGVERARAVERQRLQSLEVAEEQAWAEATVVAWTRDRAERTRGREGP